MGEFQSIGDEKRLPIRLIIGSSALNLRSESVMYQFHEAATVNTRGRITLPKPVRRALRLGAGGKVADVNAQGEDGDTALHRASGNIEMVKLLLSRSAHGAIVNRYGDKALTDDAFGQVTPARR